MATDKPRGEEIEPQNQHVADDDLFSVDVHVEDPTFGAAYPTIQWHNGDPKAKKSGGLEYEGGFFISADQGIEVPGAVEHVLVTDRGEEIKGYAVRDLEIIPIRFRRCWLAKADDKGLFTRFPWNGYEDAKEYDYKNQARGRGQLLCLVKGMTDPVVISFGGMTAAAMFSAGKNRGVLPTFAQTIVSRAKQLAKKKGRDIDYPMCSFSMKIGPKRDAKGVPVFDTVGSGDETSQITQPAWLDKPEGLPDEALIKRLFVGRELYGKVEGMHRSADEWTKQWSADELLKNLKRSASNRKALRDVKKALADDGEGDETGLPESGSTPF